MLAEICSSLSSLTMPVRHIAMMSGVLSLCVIYFGLMQYYVSFGYVFRQTFIEQDPNLSSPYVANKHVPNAMLAGLSVGVSAFALIVSLIFNSLDPVNNTSNTSRSVHRLQTKLSIKTKVHYIVVIFLGFGITLLTNSAVTNTLKIMFGEPRPNFFGLCDYKGYREALQTGNYTSYLANTKFGQFGDPVHCSASTSEVIDSFASFPSGHSSLMFASVCYVSLILLAHRHRDLLSYIVSSVVTMGLIVLSFWVSYTRVLDYYHRTYDVFAGICLGTMIGWLTYVFTYDVIAKNSLSLIYRKTPENEYENDDQRSVPLGGNGSV